MNINLEKVGTLYRQGSSLIGRTLDRPFPVEVNIIEYKSFGLESNL